MASNFIPDFVTSGTYPAFCRGAIQVNGSGSLSTIRPAASTLRVRLAGAGSVAAFNWPAFYAADFNHLAYDPNVTYQPPLKADGTPLTGPLTDAAGNQIDLKTVQTDPYLSPLSTVDLSVTVTVPLYCNTDWPIITNPLAIGEVGNAAGEYMPGAGAYCRINGTQYDAERQRRAGGRGRLQLPVAESWRGCRRRRVSERSSVLLAPERDAADLVRQDEPELAADVQAAGTWKCTAGRQPHLPALAATDLLSPEHFDILHCVEHDVLVPPRPATRIPRTTSAVVSAPSAAMHGYHRPVPRRHGKATVPATSRPTAAPRGAAAPAPAAAAWVRAARFLPALTISQHQRAAPRGNCRP